MNIQAYAAASGLTEVFRSEANPCPKPEKPCPFSIRLTSTEREYLKAQAGRQPLGAYIREKLLAGQEAQRRSYRIPIGNEPQIAALLAELGKTHIASNLNQLARSAHMGTLDISQDTEQQLKDACDAVLAMRDTLLMALNMRTGSGKP